MEEMNRGLPSFATNQGGPIEIIVDEVSVFHIYPLNGKEASDKITCFFQKCKEDHTYWNKCHLMHSNTSMSVTLQSSS